ncbi:MAG: cobyrinate a,c-diamide synthase [Hyphomicrobiales bacterium]|nr:cobyrinate a,c-diamide synthase [Hyphomicrobiales bacterium]
MAHKGLLIAAAASGSGKTLISLALLRALKNRGLSICGAKSGPDYIDPKFHEAATGAASVNLDGWAMDRDMLRGRAAGQPADYLLIEGAMGVLDGAGLDGAGSVADLAGALGLPIALIIDVARQGQSAILPVIGLKTLRPDIRLAGIILNRIGSRRHLAMIEAACRTESINLLGVMPRDPRLTLPERHLGLVQAQEHATLNALIEHAAETIAGNCDLERIVEAFSPFAAAEKPALRLPPLGQRIAVARDVAFAFSYPHMLTDWRDSGAEIHVFSPLADEVPPADVDAIFLPGGYPELHGGALAAAHGFRAGMRRAGERGVRIYGECGGYMALGDVLTDAEGVEHSMLGLLPLATSFAARKLHLGYRELTPCAGAPWRMPLAGHEFHYATTTREGAAKRLFTMRDSFGEDLGGAGLQAGSVCGSFAHIIGVWPDAV